MGADRELRRALPYSFGRSDGFDNSEGTPDPGFSVAIAWNVPALTDLYFCGREGIASDDKLG
jgi:hypothetical protein